MRVETHRNFRDIRSTEATRVVIYDKFENPIAIALEIGDGVILAETIGAPKFPELLRQLGLANTVMSQEVTQIPLPEIRL